MINRTQRLSRAHSNQCSRVITVPGMATLGLSAVKQVLIYAKKTYTIQEEEEIIKKIEESAKKFDSRGELTEKEMYNVLKIMNKVDISQDQVYAILEHLPRKRNGKIKLEEFLNLPIISEDAFKAIDRNKDGFLTRGELKLTNRNATMGDVNEIIEENDKNMDKRLCINEYRDFLEEELEEEELERSKESNNISAKDQADLDKLRDFLNN